MSETQKINRFRGGTEPYTDVATRGEETIAVSVSYSPFWKGLDQTDGYAIVRFVVHGGAADPASFKNFSIRSRQASYRPLDEHDVQDYDHAFTGTRLNKLAIKLFDGCPLRNALPSYDAEHGYTIQLTAWIADQLQKDGFALIVDDLVEIVQKGLFGYGSEGLGSQNATFALELPPSLSRFKAKLDAELAAQNAPFSGVDFDAGPESEGDEFGDDDPDAEEDPDAEDDELID